jgi:glycosyltransferase involved in cell wall biosynthesis
MSTSPTPRVLHVITRLNVGGPASQVLGLLDGLEGHGYRVAVATGTPAADEADFTQLRTDVRRRVYLPGLRPEPNPVDDLRALLALDRLVARSRPDLLHTHTAKAGLLGRLVARRQRLPVVHTFHGHLLHGYFSPRATAAITHLERRLAPRTDRLIAVGQRVRDELVAAGIGTPERHVVIPPGIDPSPPADPVAARGRLDVAPNAPVLACVGRLTGIKRPDRLLAVAARLRDRHPDLVVLLAGDGELRDQLEAEAGRQRIDVRFLGWRGDVATVYAAADIAVLTSDNEGMPVALIEAAQCGRPAVATDVGSVAEVVDHGRTGLVVPPQVDALAVSIDTLLADPDRRAAMGAAAAAHAHERFSVAALAQATATVYDDVLRSGSANVPQRRVGSDGDRAVPTPDGRGGMRT